MQLLEIIWVRPVESDHSINGTNFVHYQTARLYSYTHYLYLMNSHSQKDWVEHVNINC